MRTPIGDMHDFEASHFINKLIRFLGRNTIDRCLQKYKIALISSGPVFREYYLRMRHPWWEPLSAYFQIEKQGKSIKNNLTIEMKLLAEYGLKISTLQRYMPEKIKEQYRKNLIDDNNAINYLFEIDIAWHFFAKGCKIEWYDDDSTTHSEFFVKTPIFDFNVECKRFNVDLARKIRRKDFYRLAEKLLPAIEEKGYSGIIDIKLKDRLHSNEDYLNELTSQVIDIITNNEIINGSFQISFGSIIMNLQKSKSNAINFLERYKKLDAKLHEIKPNRAHEIIFAMSEDGKPVNPIEMTIISEKSDNVLDTIRERFSKKAKRQLDNSKPGLIVCFIEGITGDDLKKLSSNSALQIMTYYLFQKDSFNHIAAIGYCGEILIEKSAYAESYSNPELLFRNYNCKFEIARNYDYLGK
ncbi:MAG: hypothetical protein WBW55_12475 [Desulfobaccales bacterium]